MSSIKADNLFNVKGMVFVISGGGSGKLGIFFQKEKKTYIYNLSILFPN
jgi:hypothetical protein